MKPHRRMTQVFLLTYVTSVMENFSLPALDLSFFPKFCPRAPLPRCLQRNHQTAPSRFLQHSCIMRCWNTRIRHACDAQRNLNNNRVKRANPIEMSRHGALTFRDFETTSLSRIIASAKLLSSSLSPRKHFILIAKARQLYFTNKDARTNRAKLCRAVCRAASTHAR